MRKVIDFTSASDNISEKKGIFDGWLYKQAPQI